MAELRDIRSLTKEDLRTWMAAAGEPAFRGDQVYEWLWSKQALDFQDMTNLPKALRSRLETDFAFPQQSLATVQRSSDGTLKNAVKLHDDLVVESVLIPTEKRITACVSSQVGCSLNCAFCATAKLKRMRNLDPQEIFDQVVTIHKQGLEEFGRPLTNIVFMGMGEPRNCSGASALRSCPTPRSVRFRCRNSSSWRSPARSVPVPASSSWTNRQRR
jgi:23S rRNA (adenine2503-C2)-methyltransferase